MTDNDRDAGEEMVHEMGIDPAMDIDSDQRAELLRKWHERDAEADAERHKKEQQQKRKP